LKQKKIWCVIFFKCLDHDQMVELRIYMFKVIYLSKILFSAIHFAPMIEVLPTHKNTEF